MESERVPTGLITSFGNQECERVPDRFCLLSQVGGLCAGPGRLVGAGGGGAPRWDGRGCPSWTPSERVPRSEHHNFFTDLKEVSDFD